LFAAFFNCIEVDGIRYLASDTSLLCSDDRHNAFLAFAIVAVLIFPVGIPLFVLLLLLRYRHHMNDQSVKPWLGFISEAYTSKMAYFELVDMAVKLCL
jgi:hypothetical protein